MITQDRDLHTGDPVWTAYTKPRIAHKALNKSLSTDIAIIGGGISGAMIAEGLSGHGMDIAILDKRKPLSGSTSASTALLQYEIDEPLSKLSEKIGYAKAASAWRRSRLGVESLAAKIQDLTIDCAFERKDSLYIAGNVLNSQQLKQEMEIRAAIGLPSKYLTLKMIADDYGMKADAALLNRGNIACNPVQLAAGFLKAAIEKGATLYTPVEITDVAENKNGIVLKTSDGLTVRTKYLIYASGYEIPAVTKTRKHKIFSTWAIASAPVKGLSLPIFWQAADPYFYGRTTQDGRMIFGGEDEEFSDAEKRDALNAEKQKALMRKLGKLLPAHKFEITHGWSGSFGASTTGLPSIGKIPRHKNCYAVMAYGGNGITFSRIAAEIIAADILGHKDPDAELFAFK